MEAEKRLVEAEESGKLGYIWRPYVFSIGDQCIFLPPQSHKEVWDQIEEFYGQVGTVLKRHRGVSTSGIEDEYDVIFREHSTVVTELPGIYLRSVSDS